MVRSRKSRYPKVVFCDMSKEEGETGYERIFGSPGNLRYFAAFDVSLKYLKRLQTYLLTVVLRD